jgi:hypothetical protein
MTARCELVRHDPPGNIRRMRAVVDDVLSKPVPMSDKPESERTPIDMAFQRSCPALWEYLTQGKYPDGSPRQKSSLLLFPQDGAFKIMLKDPDAGRCLWAASPTITGLFTVLEGALNEPQPDWRVDRKAPGQSAKRITKAG